MGGHDKALVVLDGSTLLEQVLHNIAHSTVDNGLIAHTAVVSSRLTDKDILAHAPADLSVSLTKENPEFSGPLAAVAAGAKALRTWEHANRMALSRIAIVTVDAPHSPRMLPLLDAALTSAADADVALVTSDGGFANPLCSVWKAPLLLAVCDQLEDANKLVNGSARQLLTGVNVVEIEGNGSDTDFDAPEDFPEASTWQLPSA